MGASPSGVLKHLDIGAGRGELIREIAGKIRCDSSACDYHVERFDVEDIPLVAVDLNASPLPYADESFDVVTCSEVVEHLENFRRLLREAFRVLKPGGLFVVTTPNVLNMNSRIRYLLTGFANLFGPLPTRNQNLYSVGGHITPIACFYLAHGLLDAGFEAVTTDIDKVQRSSAFWAVLIYPFIYFGRKRFFHRETARYKTLNAANEPYVAEHFSWKVLVGRTIVVSALKPVLQPHQP